MKFFSTYLKRDDFQKIPSSKCSHYLTLKSDDKLNIHFRVNIYQNERIFHASQIIYSPNKVEPHQIVRNFKSAHTTTIDQILNSVFIFVVSCEVQNTTIYECVNTQTLFSGNISCIKQCFRKV